MKIFKISLFRYCLASICVGFGYLAKLRKVEWDKHKNKADVWFKTR